MKEWDDEGKRRAQYQGELFALSREQVASSSAIFLRRYMNSKVARRLDREGFLFEACDTETVFQEIEEEFGSSDYGKVKFEREELYWLGYLYRYWSYTRGLSSKQVYQIKKPSELRALYFPYHSLDPEQVIERILETEGEVETTYTEKGKQILRRIMEEGEPYQA